MNKNNLFFIEDENDKENRKTKRFNVYSNNSKDFLGKIHWRSGWRCYVISYESNIDMSLSCNKELDAFMEKLETDRKQEKVIKNE
ncbi:MAG: hypothetical protein M0R17_05890 [Candidatus Omnitrophica bacterium]|nr:hypothetical protein [Candidatus Omnitrophota bacterium]